MSLFEEMSDRLSCRRTYEPEGGSAPFLPHKSVSAGVWSAPSGRRVCAKTREIKKAVVPTQFTRLARRVIAVLRLV